MSEQLVTLIVAPATAWFLAFFVLLLGILEWGNLIYFRLHGVRQQLDQALHWLESSPEDVEAFAEAFRPLNAKWGGIAFLQLTWSAFRGTIVMPAGGGGVRSLVRATAFFDPDLLLPMALPMRRIRAVPYFLLGTGGMASLVMLLTTLLVYLRGATPDDGAAVQAIVQDAWRYLPLQLLPTAMGVFVGIWVGLESRRHLAGLEARIRQFAQGVESRIHYMADATLLVDHLRSTGQTAGVGLPADWTERLVDALRDLLKEQNISSHKGVEAEGLWVRKMEEIFAPMAQELERNGARWESLLELLDKSNSRRNEGLERLGQRFGEMQKVTTRELDQTLTAAVQGVGIQVGAAFQEQMERLAKRQEQGERWRGDLNTTLATLAQANQSQAERLAQVLEGVRSALEQIRQILHSGSTQQQAELREQWRQMRTLVQELAKDIHQGLDRQQEKIVPTLTRFSATLAELESRQAVHEQKVQKNILETVTSTLHDEGERLVKRQGESAQQLLHEVRQRMASLVPDDARHLSVLAEKLERVLVVLSARGGGSGGSEGSGGSGGEGNGVSLEPVIAWVQEESARMAERHEALLRGVLGEWLAAIPDQGVEREQLERFMQRMEAASHKLEEGIDLLTSVGSLDAQSAPPQGHEQAIVDGMAAVKTLLEGIREELHLREQSAADLQAGLERLERGLVENGVRETGDDGGQGAGDNGVQGAGSLAGPGQSPGGVWGGAPTNKDGVQGTGDRTGPGQSPGGVWGGAPMEQLVGESLARFERQLQENIDQFLNDHGRKMTGSLHVAEEGLLSLLTRFQEQVASSQERDRSDQQVQEGLHQLQEALLWQMQAEGGKVDGIGQAVREGLARLEERLRDQPAAFWADGGQKISDLVQGLARELGVQVSATLTADLRQQTDVLQETLQEIGRRPVALTQAAVSELAERVRGGVSQATEEALLTLMTLFQEHLERGQGQQQAAFRELLSGMTTHLEGLFAQGLKPAGETLTWLREALTHNTTTAQQELLAQMGQLARQVEASHQVGEQERKAAFQTALEALFERMRGVVDERLEPIRVALEEVRGTVGDEVALANQELMEKMLHLTNRIEEVQENAADILSELATLDEPFIQLAAAIRESITGMEQTQDAVFFFTEKFPELLATYLEAIEDENDRSQTQGDQP
ncbi:MAG: hypothetical protein HQL64_12070 [Magnetococcales bacterium]|nr:hypothetical protein [Magnetococcales bacterium]